MRGLLVVLLMSLAAAGLVAFVSRAPEEVRAPALNLISNDVDPERPFTDEQVARHGAYRGPIYLSIALILVLEIVLLVALARGPFQTLIARLPGAWPVNAALAGVALGIALWLVALPISYVRGFALQHAWGLSTQDTLGWVSDQLKGAGVSAILSAVAAVAFIGVQRWQPRWWWLIGWAAFTFMTALLTFLFPVLIAPLFNTFTPVDEPLATRVKDLADRAGVHVEDVFVSDASRRTIAENAYVAGFGATKRVVLDDTLLQGGDEPQTMFVVAHELGHEAEGHVVKSVALSSLGLLVGFALLAWLSRRAGLWVWAAGARGPGDVAALPVVVLIAAVLGSLATPLSSLVSRRFEARADEIAIELTQDPDAAASAFQRLAVRNIADLRPPAIAVATLFTHPPIPDRIRAAMAQRQQQP